MSTNAQRAYWRQYYREHAKQVAGYYRSYYAYNQSLYGKEQAWIKEARLRLGWSQKALGEKIGVSQGTITKLETGATPIGGFSKRDKLLEVLGVTE